jgi:hypothetical protein
MGVDSLRVVQYTIECDNCGQNDCCPSSSSERVHTKHQAIMWAGMHNTKDGVLCDKCFKKRNRKAEVQDEQN